MGVMSSPLISVPVLRGLLDDPHAPDVTLLDVRYRLGGPAGPEQHAAGHLPGAAYVDLDTDLAAPPASTPDGGGRHPLPATEDLQAAMRRLGVDDGRPVVVYDDWSGLAAARAWWLLRHHGHSNVRVLDGGWAAWLAGGGSVETGPVDPAPGGFTARPGRMPVVELDGVLDVDVLVDARAPGRYRGEAEPMDPVAGRVPGAVNVPTTTNLTSAGTFRDATTLRALYAAEGVEPGADVAAYCGSGVTACHDVLAMEVAGIRAALYPGSWSEWSADPTRPVERG